MYLYPAYDCFVSDEAKVGQKILEKMGWKKGMALGLNEDGCKEHIKVFTKSDRKGLCSTVRCCNVSFSVSYNH